MIQRLIEDDERQYHRPNDKWIEVPVTTVTADGETTTITVRKRSLRSKRRVFTLSCTAFIIGGLMIIMSSPYSNEFLVPGGLSSNHAQILAGQGADRCAACHAAAGGSLAGWIANTISLGKSQGLTQPELCMKCHDKTINPETSLNPHNVEPDEMAKISSKYQPASFDAGMVFQPPVSGHNIACNACHREHHGAKADLALMTDNQCQSCHQSSYHSFETDHPEFTNYPLARRSRIAFDHSSHAGKHFPSKQTDFNCNQCHLDDNFQNVKKMAGYEQACASCHHEQIIESGKDGLALIALPMLDTRAIEDAKLKIGSWPKAATGDFDGELPPIMRVLLTADDEAAKVLDRFGPSFDFSDIDPANANDVKDAVKLVWAIKRLLYDLAIDGPRAVRTRLESVMHLEVSDDELQEMVTNLDEPVFQNAVRRWLPNLKVEVANHRFSNTEPSANESLAFSDTESKAVLKKSDKFWWPSEDALLSRVARQDDLLAENPLAKLMKPGTSETKPETPVAVVRVPAKTNSPEQPGKPADNSNAKITLKNAHADPLNDPDLLAVNPLQKSTGATPSAPVQNLPKIKTPNPPQQGVVNQTPTQTAVTPALPSEPVPASFGASEFVRSDRKPIVIPSGWYRDDSLFQISYRPSGHADSCVQSWIELVTRAADADSRPETKQLFEKTISMTSVGLCRTCHTVDQLPDRSFAVNWVAEYRDPSRRTFTRFAHGPHMIQPNLQDCSHCHKLDPESSNALSFHSVDSADAVSNFKPMMKSDCASCHAASQTDSGCTQCHDYHVGSRITGGQ